jgi:hypothetical protein
MTLRSWMVGLVAAVASAAPALAAPPVGITHAVSVPRAGATAPYIEVVFAKIFETSAAAAAAQDHTKYRLVDLYAGPGRTFAPQELAIGSAVVPALQWLPAEQLNTVQLFLATDLPASEDDRYILIVSGLSIGKTPVAVSSSPARVTMGIGAPGPVAPQWVKAKDKDSADMYFSGSISSSAAKDFYGNADIKFRYPTLERPIANRLHSFAPSFDLAASDNPDADPDSLKLGMVWQFYPIQKRGALLPITRWENALEHESSKNFDYRTVVWRSEWLFLPAAWPIGDNGAFWINPLAGIAAGEILEVPENAFDSGALFRLLAGISVTLEVPLFFAKQLSINAEYQLRRQYQDELAGALTLGRGSHPWTSIKAGVAFNDFVSFGAVFQDGEQPPKYKEVNRSISFDLTFKAARKNKPQ